MDLIDILRRQLEQAAGDPPARTRSQGPARTGLENVEAESRRLEEQLGVGREADPHPQPAPPGRGQAAPDDVLAEIFDMIQRKGGVGGVTDEFRRRGMQEEADSWVSTGPNRPINGRQVETVFPDDLKRMADRLGIPPEQLAEALSKALPQTIDHATPHGRIDPQASSSVVEQARDFLRRNAGRVI
ncbi:MAG: hypothetical protein KatS3mg108_0387 [Isosphaeraceae bacterium]|jgi:uncharacterized protein YidB (DUF937 family)|nr:MAG: hypothetical protein KatS3mg108_0387 [Isosphaeraceae bacterium]